MHYPEKYWVIFSACLPVQTVCCRQQKIHSVTLNVRLAILAQLFTLQNKTEWQTVILGIMFKVSTTNIVYFCVKVCNNISSDILSSIFSNRMSELIIIIKHSS